MDSFSIIAFSAGVGGASGKFVEKVWDLGEKWLMTYFREHSANAQKHAKNNSLDFLVELAERVKRLEDDNLLNHKRINNAQDQPDFYGILQKAMLFLRKQIKRKNIRFWPHW